MGGIPRIYARPVRNYPADKWRSTFRAHTRRTPPSQEPGVDYYCPIGTELVSLGDGVVVEVGGSIYAKTGRYVKVNLDTGQAFRLLHLGPAHSLVARGHRVKKGQSLAISGASGYGSEYFGASSPSDPTMIRNTGGPHTHATLFPTWFYNNFNGLLDLEEWVELEEEEDDMGTLDNSAANLQVIKNAMFEFMRDTGANIKGDGTNAYRFIDEAIWGQPIQAMDALGNGVVDASGNPVRYAAFGYLASINAQLGALTEVVKTLAVAQGNDPDAIAALVEDAAERGAREALATLVLASVSPDGSSDQ